ncbi:hypothetical protein B0H11DRAFT_1962561 [Mycena galericulata]|nr:hypothetical protein B0H11DRAFT_1962561 [Mycena galericulata]
MDSPFKGILHTNAVPTDPECEAIRDFLKNPRRKLAELTEEITRLQSLRDELNHFIDAHLALVSPARRLPEDVVRAIFMASLPSTRNCALSGDEPPLLLCQISSAWRSVAFATPRLWASIHIVVPDQPGVERLTNRVTTWLARSRAVPLDVSLVFSNTCMRPCEISSLVSALVAESRRWKNLTFPLSGTRTNYYLSSLPSLTPEDVPQLQSIALSIPAITPTLAPGRNTVSAENPSESFSFLAAKTLRSVSLPGNGFYLQNISWGSLKHLSITRDGRALLTSDMALRILRQCTVLETCELFLTSRRPVNTGSLLHASPFCLPQLSHLLFDTDRFMTWDGVPQFFSNMALPALRSFRCSGFIGSGIDPAPQCLFPTTVALQSLKVAIKGLPSRILLGVLSEMPALQELHISRDPHLATRRPDPDFLQHLTPSTEAPDTALCPQLISLELMWFSAVSDEMLLKFIQARTNVNLPGIARLSRASVTLQRQMQLDIVPDLHDAISDGLEINLKYVTLPVITYSPLEGT